jgi:hypothetical protein
MDSAAHRFLCLKRADAIRDYARHLVRIKDSYAAHPLRGTTATPHRVLARAATGFEKAARAYRDAGLGLLARQCWEEAAQCHRRLFREQKEAWCLKRLDAIPIVWNGEGCEPVDRAD